MIGPTAKRLDELYAGTFLIFTIGSIIRVVFKPIFNMDTYVPYDARQYCYAIILTFSYEYDYVVNMPRFLELCRKPIIEYDETISLTPLENTYEECTRNVRKEE